MITEEEYKELLFYVEESVHHDPETQVIRVAELVGDKLTAAQFLRLMVGDTSCVEGAEKWNGSVPPGWISAQSLESLLSDATQE